MAPKILIVLTSHDQMGSSGKPTGWYLVSAVTPLLPFAFLLLAPAPRQNSPPPNAS